MGGLPWLSSSLYDRSSIGHDKDVDQPPPPGESDRLDRLASGPVVGEGASVAVARVGGPIDLWMWLSVAAALLALAGSIIGLIDGAGIYGKETRPFINQAIAQDVVNAVVVSPSILLLVVLMRRGSLRAYLVWLGALSFTVYNYVIYTMSLHVGPLFLVWVAVLGLSLYALIGGLSAADPTRVRARFTHPPDRVVGWFLIITAVLFAALWLREIIPSLLAGTAPQSSRELALPANPVHVLDLSFFLPAVLAAGVLSLRASPLGSLLAPPSLVFVVATGLPILLTPFIAQARGDNPGWSVLGPVGLITAIGLAVLIRLLATASAPEHRDHDEPTRGAVR